jgi:S-adenosylmethionine hydrolase
MIVFASDFGQADAYVGVVEAVIASLVPDARVIHLAHDIAPQDLRGGSYVLYSALPHLPKGAIVLAVVDPGVGSARRAIAAHGKRFSYVGPDNGLFGAAWKLDPPQEACVLARDPAARARTFDGRDLFGPTAAALAGGAPLSVLGAAIDPVTLVPAVALPTRSARGEVWTFDRYGNAITTLEADFDDVATITIAGKSLRLATHFASVARGELVAYVGSSGLVEIAVRDGSARETLGLSTGARVERLS